MDNKIILLLTLIFLFFSRVLYSSISVSPLTIPIYADKNKINKFTFKVSSSIKQKIKLTVQDVTQLEEGYVSFKKLEKENSLTDWVSLDKDIISFKKQETLEITSLVKPPANAKGTNLIAIIVEKYTNKKNKPGIAINIRYIVILKIKINEKNRKKRGKIKIESMEMVKIGDKMILTGLLQNLSKNIELISTKSQIRNNKKQHIESINLQTEAGWKKKKDTFVLYPLSTVRIVGLINKEIKKGTYNLKIKNRVSGKNQSMIKETVLYDKNTKSIPKNKFNYLFDLEKIKK